jgi:hypothetical protein
VPFESVGPDELHFTCPDQEKLRLLHELTAQGEGVLDVVVRAPRLEDVYAYFVNGERA